MQRTLQALLAVFLAAWLVTGAPPAMAQDAAVIAKGEYLARAGDCIACHTAREGKIFAGGLPMKTPFGTLYTSNITPDLQTGIGMWTSDQFYQMMHNGRFPDGGLVYPAMPFASYTKVTREDSDAIYAYLRSIPPVKQINRPHDLKFPFSNRSLILGWRTLFFKEGVYKPDPTKSADWNRGAYLVEGLGHCGMCHTAINALGGSSESQAFEGGLIPMQNWYAPSLTICARASRPAARSTGRWRKSSTTACNISMTTTPARWRST
jgi:mono/diheme cytochrome c family protein